MDLPTTLPYVARAPNEFQRCQLLTIGARKTSLNTCHTPLEGLSGSGQFTRLMTFTQLIFGISGTQNRRDQNFLTSTFSVIAILIYPTFPYCFYYIAILQLSHFREIFTIFLASSDKMYLES